MNQTFFQRAIPIIAATDYGRLTRTPVTSSKLEHDVSALFGSDASKIPDDALGDFYRGALDMMASYAGSETSFEENLAYVLPKTIDTIVQRSPPDNRRSLNIVLATIACIKAAIDWSRTGNPGDGSTGTEELETNIPMVKLTTIIESLEVRQLNSEGRHSWHLRRLGDSKQN